MTPESPADELRRLETALAGWTRDRVEVERRLHPDFFEFGVSGRIWSRSEVTAVFGHEAPHALDVSDFAVRMLAGDVALVTYRSVPEGEGETIRSSIWVRRDGRWQRAFHQGTRTESGTRPRSI